MFAIFKDYQADPTFRCDMCQRVLGKAWSDDEAVKEMHSRFPGATKSEVLVVCDDCNDSLQRSNSRNSVGVTKY
jgi:antirestriction protein